jgi:hypothetical protein
MGLEYRGGSIFTSTAHTLVVPVNCKGVAGWKVTYSSTCEVV